MKHKIIGHILLGIAGAGTATIADSGKEILVGVLCGLAIIVGCKLIDSD